MGCISIQTQKNNSKVRSFGLAFKKTIKCQEGEIHKVTVPGICVRFSSLLPGISFGWHEALYFYTNSEKENAEPVAYQSKVIGMDVGDSTLSLGYNRTLSIIVPEEKEGKIQYFSYSEKKPSKSIIIRKDYP